METTECKTTECKTLLPKLDELRCTKDIATGRCSVVGITESHLSANINDSEVTLKGYTLFRRDRIGRRGGGVIAYVRDKYNCNNRTDIQTPDIESL